MHFFSRMAPENMIDDKSCLVRNTILLALTDGMYRMTTLLINHIVVSSFAQSFGVGHRSNPLGKENFR